MGIGMESGIISQSKKGQSETNDRLDALLAEQKRTNQLLEWVGGMLAGQTAATPG